MVMVNSPIVHAKNVGVWEKVCGDQANPKTCRIRQDLFLQKKNNEGKLVTLGRVLRLNVVYSNVDNGTKRIPFLSIQVPMGVDLRAGTVFQIDNAKQINLPYLRCTTYGCDASVKLSRDILRNMKAGNQIKVGFKKWGDKNASVISATLKGFTAALAGIK
tara:strand:- start:99 stop:578 length:480 start_codon:yes stop_codon:yes gene_type:complete